MICGMERLTLGGAGGAGGPFPGACRLVWSNILSISAIRSLILVISGGARVSIPPGA
jgi:hypothetical protein